MSSWFYKLRRLLITGNSSDTFAVKTDSGSTVLSADTRNQTTAAKGLNVDAVTAANVTVTGLTVLGSGEPDPDGAPGITAALTAADDLIVTGVGKKVKAPAFEQTGGQYVSVIFYAKKTADATDLTKYWLTFSGQLFVSCIEEAPET